MGRQAGVDGIRTANSVLSTTPNLPRNLQVEILTTTTRMVPTSHFRGPQPLLRAYPGCPRSRRRALASHAVGSAMATVADVGTSAGAVVEVTVVWIGSLGNGEAAAAICRTNENLARRHL